MIAHLDTERIAWRRAKSIPCVSDTGKSHVYALSVDPYLWQKWNERLRRHVKSAGLKWEKIAEALDMSEPGVRHWLNGTRDISLKEFFALCKAAQASPAQMLFEASVLDAEQEAALRQLQGRPPQIEVTPARRPLAARRR